MSDKIDRKRKVDVDKLTEEQLQALIDQLGDKVRDMVDETCDRANVILKVYGLRAKMQVVIEQND
jgi:hypothetical protein